MMRAVDELDFIKAELQGLSLSDLGEVSEKSTVPLGTLVKIFYGTTRNPQYLTVKALAAYFRARHESVV